MPYIKNDRRAELETTIGLLELLTNLQRVPDLTDGDLNYILSNIMVGQWEADKSYKTLNKLIGVLECVKLELYRRAGAPYEDAKKKLNGDVY